ncbi:MAG TPA: DUF222 domain-containing protein [Cellulomonas sp.]
MTALRICSPGATLTHVPPRSSAPRTTPSAPPPHGSAPDDAPAADPDVDADADADADAASDDAGTDIADPSTDPGSAADALSRVRPGPDLLAVLLGTAPGATADAVVVEVVAAWSRLGSWVHAQAAGWACVLSGRESMNPVWSDAAGGAPARSSVAGDELAMRLAVSRRAATSLVTEGRAYAGALVATGDALTAGRIDPARAKLLVDRLGPLPLPVTLAVEDRVLAGAERRTLGQLRRDIERALVEVDGAEAVTRHRRARAGRRVEHPRLLPDGMAGMWCVLPAGDAARVDGVLDGTARTCRTAGDPRTLDQLRADLLRDLVVDDRRPRDPGSAQGRWHSGGPAPGSSRSCEPGPGDPRTCTPAPADPRPCEGAPGGSPSCEPASDGPIPRGPAPGGPPPLGPTPNDPTAEDPTAHGCAPDGPVAGRVTSRVEVQVTVPLSTLLGCDDGPGHIAGLGPVDAVQARALAAGGVWRRIVTDPLTGAVLDVGRRRYRPTAAMIAHVQARDVRCARPGCDVDARRADLDHTVEFHAPPGVAVGSTATEQTRPRSGEPGTGTTAVPNLGPLCRRDHRLKTDGGHTLSQPSPGLFEWITPTGHTYRLRPGADSAYQHRTGTSTGLSTGAGTGLGVGAGLGIGAGHDQAESPAPRPVPGRTARAAPTPPRTADDDPPPY